MVSYTTLPGSDEGARLAVDRTTTFREVPASWTVEPSPFAGRPEWGPPVVPDGTASRRRAPVEGIRVAGSG